MDVLSGDEMRRVGEARELGALLMGRPAPVAAVDDYLIDCHEQRLTGEQILERARATPPKPDRLGKPVYEWKTDPTMSLLGPWVEPADIHEAVARLEALDTFVEKRRVLLAMACYLIRYHALWSSVPGCKGLEDLCLDHLEMGERTFHRYATAGLDYFWHPEVKAEVDAGRLTTEQGWFAIDHADAEYSLEQWLELVRRLSRVELTRAQGTGARSAAKRTGPRSRWRATWRRSFARGKRAAWARPPTG